MSKEQNSPSGRFIDAAALHTDEPIFDHINPPNTVAATKNIQHFHDPKRRQTNTALLGFHQIAVEAKLTQYRLQILTPQRDAKASLKYQLQIFCNVRGLVRRDAQLLPIRERRTALDDPRLSVARSF